MMGFKLNANAGWPMMNILWIVVAIVAIVYILKQFNVIDGFNTIEGFNNNNNLYLLLIPLVLWVLAKNFVKSNGSFKQMVHDPWAYIIVTISIVAIVYILNQFNVIDGFTLIEGFNNDNYLYILLIPFFILLAYGLKTFRIGGRTRK